MRATIDLGCPCGCAEPLRPPGLWAPYATCRTCGSGVTAPSRVSTHWTPGQEPSADQHAIWGGRGAQWAYAVGPGPGRVIDVGCGFGHFLLWASERGWDAVGVEPDAWARERTVAPGRVVADLADAGADADLLTLWDVLEHVADPIAMATSLRALLRPGGRLLVCSPDFRAVKLRWPLARRDPQRFHALVRPDEHAVQFTPRGLALTLSRAGYAPVTALHPPLSRRAGALAALAGHIPGLRRGLFVIGHAPG